MSQFSVPRRFQAGVCVAAIVSSALCASGGLAQPAPVTGMASAPIARSNADVTTVAPVTVLGLAPVPNVGAGATYLTPEELKVAAHDAREAVVDLHYNPCGNGMGPTSVEDFGIFTLGALYDTERVRQMQLQNTAQAADAATEAALGARAAAARGEADDGALNATELTRQSAVKAFQAAQAAMFEAEFRIADLEDQAEQLYSNNTGVVQNQLELRRSGIQAYVDEQTRRRSINGGASGVYVPDEYKDLGFTDIAAAQVDDKGQPAIRITGTIHNPRKGSIAVPPIWISAVDPYGTPLQIEQAQAPRDQKRIPAGGVLAFDYEIKPMPDKTVRAVITFAPFHHPPRYKPAGYFCGNGLPGTIGVGGGGLGGAPKDYSGFVPSPMLGGSTVTVPGF